MLIRISSYSMRRQIRRMHNQIRKLRRINKNTAGSHLSYNSLDLFTCTSFQQSVNLPIFPTLYSSEFQVVKNILN